MVEVLACVVGGAALGLLTTMLGGGGALFLVPILVYGFDKTPADAAGTSLAALVASALVGAVGHWRAGHVRPRVALGFGLFAMLGAAAGSWLHRWLSPRTAMLAFSAILFFAAWRLLRGVSSDAPRAAPDWSRLAPVGLGIGVVAGLLGTSGGFLIVPALIFWAGMGTHDAIGTAVVVVILSAGVGALTHAALGHVAPAFTLPVAGGAVLGALVGGRFAGALPERPLQLGLAALLVVAGLFVLVRAW